MLSTLPQTPLGWFAASVIALAFAKWIYSSVKLYFVRREFKRKHGCKPAQFHRFWSTCVLGIDFLLGQHRASKEGRLLERISAEYKYPYMTWTGWLLMSPFIGTTDKDNVKAVLSDRFYDFGLSRRKNAFGPLLGDGIFTLDGHGWKNSRSIIKPNFERKQVANLAAFENHFLTLLKILPRDNGHTAIDLQPLFFRLTIDSATEFFFGKCSYSLKTALEKGNECDSKFAAAFNYAQVACETRIRMGDFYMLYHDKKDLESIKICHSFVEQYVDEALHRRSNPPKKEDTSDNSHMSNSRYFVLDELSKHLSDRTRLRDELLNVLLAGRDTTASLLSNLFFVISQREDVWNKLQAEIEDALHGRVPTYEELKSLTYLRYCLQESLRVHPVVPLNTRYAVRDTVLPRGGGPDGMSPLFVKKGTQVGYHAFVMHRRKDYFGEDANEFRPERWETLRQSWAYIPFNGGPRICLGQQYALAEAGYVTVRLLQEFERMECRDGGEWTEMLSLTVCSGKGAKVGLWPRQRASTNTQIPVEA